MKDVSGTKYDIVIAGAGPAGSSAAVRLARAGLKVLLVERTRFPRQKLCGEFVSPECLEHFAELGVLPEITEAGAVAIDRTVFYSRRGTRTVIENDWSTAGSSAVGISRAEMDRQLLERARAIGTDVLEDTTVLALARENGRVTGVKLRNSDNKEFTALGTLIIDATGRHSLLQAESVRRDRAKLVALKTHLRRADLEAGSCEIYSYSGGYGGCNEVEDGLFNVCFIVRAQDVRSAGSDLDRVMRETLCKNVRAASVLRYATREKPWLSVPLERFGRGPCMPASGLLAIGDAASFMDPFTGSGILAAFQSSRIAAEVLTEYLPSDRLEMVGSEYEKRYAAGFERRLKLSSMLRYAAFVPNAAELMIRLLRINPVFGRMLARSTRS